MPVPLLLITRFGAAPTGSTVGFTARSWARKGKTFYALLEAMVKVVPEVASRLKGSPFARSSPQTISNTVLDHTFAADVIEVVIPTTFIPV
jgi:hypothetical protein